jgi:hypothetical protein
MVKKEPVQLQDIEHRPSTIYDMQLVFIVNMLVLFKINLHFWKKKVAGL